MTKEYIEELERKNLYLERDKFFDKYLIEGIEDALFKGEERYKRKSSPLDIPNGYKQGFIIGLKFYRKWGEYNGKTN